MILTDAGGAIVASFRSPDQRTRPWPMCWGRAGRHVLRRKGRRHADRPARWRAHSRPCGRSQLPRPTRGRATDLRRAVRDARFRLARQHARRLDRRRSWRWSSAYYWQAGRTREADEAGERLRLRIGAALGRGRCALWDWDLARAGWYWSHSMYEILGFEPEDRYMSFGELQKMIYPGDADLQAMAEAPHRTRCRRSDANSAFATSAANGSGSACAARRSIRPGKADAPIGIAIDITEQKSLAEHTERHDARLRDAIESPSGSMLWDAENRLVMCNSKFRMLHGLW